MKVAVTGDFHGYPPPEIPSDVELVLFAGDLGTGERFYKREGFAERTDYEAWLKSLLPRARVVGVAGNHDFDSDGFRTLPWTYLENESVDVNGLKIWGSPLSPSFGAWAHMRPDADLARTWETIPSDVDVIVTHGPPLGFCDLAQRQVHAGSSTLLHRIAYGVFPNLKLVACGHIHEGYGVDEIPAAIQNIKVVNGSYVDERYRPGNQPIVVEL